MQNRSPRIVAFYTFITFGLYALYWLAKTRDEIHAKLGEKPVPTMWWFIVPLCAYWWIWHYSSAVEKMSDARIKSSDTFLLFVLVSLASGFSVNIFPDILSGSTYWLVAFGIGALIDMAIFSIFPGVMQNKFNKLGLPDAPKSDPLITS